MSEGTLRAGSPSPLAQRYVTGSEMSESPSPSSGHPLSNAERQARHRARRNAEQDTPVIRYRRPTDRRSRPQRWHDAVRELLTLQADYTTWAEALPEALRDTVTAEALQAIVDLDLTELADIESPRGYGRD